MTKLEEIKNILHEKDASLVVCFANGEVKEYYNDRIIDIKNILLEDEKALNGAIVADKVIGKTAGALLAVGGVKEVYADVMSSLIIPIFEENNIKYEYREKVDYIVNKDKTGMCPMENKYKDVKDIKEIYNTVLSK